MAGDSKKVFTQTIRALRQDVEEIPSIELTYFDTETEEYDIAKTEPIPLNVRATKIVTVLDAEGSEAPVFSGSELKTWESGIRYNYESPDIIENQYYGPFSKLRHPMWLVMTAGPPVTYIALLLVITFRRLRSRNLDAVIAGKAFGKLKKKLGRAKESKDNVYDIVLFGLRKYLEVRLQMERKVHTFIDVEHHLANIRANEELRRRLKVLFEECEQGHYAGSNIKDPGDLLSEALSLAQLIEKKLK